MRLSRYANRPQSRLRTEWDGRHRRPSEGLHSIDYHPDDVYSDQERTWLQAVDRWKASKGPIIRAAELLVILADLGYSRQGGPLSAAEIDAALGHERRRRCLECERPGRHLTACEVLALLMGLGWSHGPRT